MEVGHNGLGGEDAVRHVDEVLNFAAVHVLTQNHETVAECVLESMQRSESAILEDALLVRFTPLEKLEF